MVNDPFGGDIHPRKYVVSNCREQFCEGNSTPATSRGSVVVDELVVVIVVSIQDWAEELDLDMGVDVERFTLPELFKELEEFEWLVRFA